MFLRIVLTVAFSGIFALPAFAQPAAAMPKSLGVFGAWTAYALTENGQKTCYMVARAHAGKSKIKRGPAWLTITDRPGENSRDVISYTSGYNYKAGSDADMRIGKNSFSLFTQQDTAWARDTLTDHQIAAAILKAPGLSVTGIPAAKGAKSVTDVIDLKDAAAAHHAIGKACGMEPETVSKPAPAKKKKTK